MFSVQYEDDFLLAVEKGPGIDTAPLDYGRGAGSLLEELLGRYPSLAALPGRKECEPGLLHRLDRDTSGLVLIAKTKEAFERLMAAQEGGLFIKRYIALCASSQAELPGAKPPRGRIEGGLVRSRFRPYGPKGARVAPLGEEIAAAGPVYETRILGSTELKGTFSFELELSRGFRHQLRAHLAWLGFPILGDAFYSFEESSRRPRLMLHAKAIRFPHPENGRLIEIDCPPPDDFKAC
jgi:23S rRNA pseudouridine1911/1915/1917 synthase